MKRTRARGLDPEYWVSIDAIDESGWNRQLPLFDDATIYQTWAYGRTKVGEARLSHLFLWHSNELASISQVRITKIPMLPYGLAYIHWGPLWKKRNAVRELSHLRNMLRALRNEYVLRRHLVLRILPKIVDEGVEQDIRSIYDEEGYVWSSDPDQTFLVNVSIPLEEIRANFRRNLKRDLNAAEKQQLRFIEGTDRDLLNVALKLLKEMKERKKYFGTEFSDLIELQEDLPAEFKIRMMCAELDGDIVAALGWQTLGKIGFPIIAATGDKGLAARASFMLWWKMIQFYHDKGFRLLDVGGVNASRNPGGYAFKSRLVGRKDPSPVRYFGQFTASNARVLARSFAMANLAKNSYRHIRAQVARFLHSP